MYMRGVIITAVGDPSYVEQSLAPPAGGISHSQ